MKTHNEQAKLAKTTYHQTKSMLTNDAHSSQFQHINIGSQSQKDLTGMFLGQFNYFLNPIKNTNLFTINTFCFGFSWSLCCCLCFFLLHASRETGIAQKAAVVNPQNNNWHPIWTYSFLFFSFLDIPYPLLGFFLIVCCPSCCPHPHSLPASWVCPFGGLTPIFVS